MYQRVRALPASLLLSAALMGGCGTPEATDADTPEALMTPEETPVADNRAAIDSFYNSIQHDYERNPEAKQARDFIQNPFADIRSEADAKTIAPYTKAILAPYELVRTPQHNAHDSTQVDTVYSLRFEAGSAIRLYRSSASGEFLLMSADLRTKRCILKDGLRVGMSQAELLEALDAYPLHRTEYSDRVLVDNTELNGTLVFLLDEGAVSRIVFEGYVD